MKTNIQKMLDNLNNIFSPISQEIEQKLEYLNNLNNTKTQYPFKKLTKEDLE